MENLYVDIWQASLSADAKSRNTMMQCLNPLEIDKAASFKLPLMRDRYILVRALSREILARYLQKTASELQFIYGEYGKPALADQQMHFNLSHTGDQLLMAVANFPHIGVDIEQVRPRTNLQGMAKRCFSSQEYQAWEVLPAAKQSDVFYTLWTKKEAYVKAIGRGIAMGLERCEVDWNTNGQLLHIPTEQGDARNWKVTELPVVAGHCAALVTPNCAFALRLIQWERVDVA